MRETKHQRSENIVSYISYTVVHNVHVQTIYFHFYINTTPAGKKKSEIKPTHPKMDINYTNTEPV